MWFGLFALFGLIGATAQPVGRESRSRLGAAASVGGGTGEEGRVHQPDALGPRGIRHLCRRHAANEGHGDGAETGLTARMQRDISAVTGRRLFTPLTGICLMIYYVFAMQCLSTVAIVRRETGGWKWPLFQIAYMTALAYGATFAAYRIGLWLGMGGG